MGLNEDINHILALISEILSAIERKDFANVKKSSIELQRDSQALRLKLLNNPSLVDHANNPAFDSLLTFIIRDISPLDISASTEDIELYFEIFSDEYVPLLNQIRAILGSINIPAVVDVHVSYSELYKRKLEIVFAKHKACIKREEKKIIDYFSHSGIPGEGDYSIPLANNLYCFNLSSNLAGHRIIYSFEIETRKINFEKIHRVLSDNDKMEIRNAFLQGWRNDFIKPQRSVLSNFGLERKIKTKHLWVQWKGDDSGKGVTVSKTPGDQIAYTKVATDVIKFIEDQI